MGNIESLIFMQYVCECEYEYEYDDKVKLNFIKKQNNHTSNSDRCNIHNSNIHNCHICNKDLSNKTIYRSNDLSFCSIKHRNSLNELKI